MDQKALVPYDVKLMPLYDLKDHPANPRTIRDTALKGLMASIERFGLIEPIIWNKRTGFIVGGHQRKKALEAAGYKEAQVLVVDFDADQEMMANLSLNNPRIQGEFTESASDLLVQYEELYPDAARELMLHDLKMDLLGDGAASDALATGSGIYDIPAIVQAAFDWYRKTGFPYQNIPKHVALQQMNRLAAIPGDLAVRSNWAYHVPDVYNPHRYHERVNGKRSLVEYFEDDAWLKKAITKELEMGGAVPAGYFGMMTSVSGSQALANFRPGFAMHLYRRFGRPGGVVLDPCTGYGGRLIGWHCSRLGGHYIGVDPSTKTCAGNRAMVVDLGIPNVALIQQPFEDSMSEIQERLGAAGAPGVDFAFTSPPYFSKEKYSEEATQSWVRYKTLDDWTEGFLWPLMKITSALLLPGGAFAVNIADVKVGGKDCNLEDRTIECGKKAGLPIEQTLRFDLPHIPGANSENFTSSEPVFIFRKPA